MSKFKNIKTNGYASKKEAKRAAELKLLEKAGKIKELQEQVKFELAPSVVVQGRKRPPLRYIADFTYKDGSGYVVEDVKGAPLTAIYKLKRHLMKSVLNLEILET